MKKEIKKVLLTIDMDVYVEAKEKADKENRSFNNYINNLIKNDLKERENNND